MCLYPRLIRNPKYLPNKKNNGKPPKVQDERVRFVPVGCQKCIECRNQKARGWRVRLLEDVRHNRNGRFITLTFSNQSIKTLCEIINKERSENKVEPLEGYELDNAIATLAVRRFLERWRKEYKRSLRHFLVTELGHNGTENIHLHGIVWSNEPLEELERIWNYGWCWKGKGDRKINYVNEQTVNYIVKYIHKTDEKHPNYQSKVLTSAGIGKGYTERMDAKNNKFNAENTEETYRTREGRKIAMPIYWRNKIYSEAEREKLWLQRLDKNERWICGEKVRADDLDSYYKLLAWHRRRNAELGYGSNAKDWEQKEYELARRKLLTQQRIDNTKTIENVQLEPRYNSLQNHYRRSYGYTDEGGSNNSN